MPSVFAGGDTEACSPSSLVNHRDSEAQRHSEGLLEGGSHGSRPAFADGLIERPGEYQTSVPPH